MEPTGIEPVTSCLQNGTAEAPNCTVFGAFSAILAARPSWDAAGLGAIGLGLGSRTGLLPK
jgi:hypothetical protein